jgi:hypothetical protein
LEKTSGLRHGLDVDINGGIAPTVKERGNTPGEKHAAGTRDF